MVPLVPPGQRARATVRLRTEGPNGAGKTTMIVSLVRKLLIALWRIVTFRLGKNPMNDDELANLDIVQLGEQTFVNAGTIPLAFCSRPPLYQADITQGNAT